MNPKGPNFDPNYTKKEDKPAAANRPPATATVNSIRRSHQQPQNQFHQEQLFPTQQNQLIVSQQSETQELYEMLEFIPSDTEENWAADVSQISNNNNNVNNNVTSSITSIHPPQQTEDLCLRHMGFIYQQNKCKAPISDLPV